MLLKPVAALISFILMCFSVVGQPVSFTIHLNDTVQTIHNFGSSGAWFTEGIGKYWAPEKKERLAELLFSSEVDSIGNPLGIGLSAFRFNIGGGTAEQGDSSGIGSAVRRVEGFLDQNESYNWDKQQGYTWFVKKAISYGVAHLVAFSNTPPVQFTRNGLGFKTEKDFTSNLRQDKYADYAGFLADVLTHFKSEGVHFNFISPVNEPQWDWSNRFGHMSQEGSPWNNNEIFKITKSLDSTLAARNISSKILITEAGDLRSLYEGGGHASKQIQTFFSPGNRRYVGQLQHVPRLITGHSYFTDTGDSTIIGVRQKIQDTAEKYGIDFWQSEYCMLGDGYKEGVTGRIPAIDCALFLAKIIHHDLTVANATAWQFWNSWEPGRANYDPRYYLIALQSNPMNTEGDFTITKNLWALGHYSRFVRPGMQRVEVGRSDHKSVYQAAQHLMVSAFANKDSLVVVAINYTAQPTTIHLQTANKKKERALHWYCTTAREDQNMQPKKIASVKNITLEPRSINTFVIGLKN